MKEEGSGYLLRVGVVTADGRTEQELQVEPQKQYRTLNLEVSDIEVRGSNSTATWSWCLVRCSNPEIFVFKGIASIRDALIRAGGASAPAPHS